MGPITESVYGVAKSQKTLPFEVKLWTVARTATRNANQSMAERNQRRTASSRKREMPIRKTDRKVAHRRGASAVSKAEAVRPVSRWKRPHRTAKDRGTRGQANVGGDSRARHTAIAASTNIPTPNT